MSTGQGRVTHPRLTARNPGTELLQFSAFLVSGMNGTLKTIEVTGPIKEPVMAQYGMIDEVAVIEMAQAAGLPCWNHITCTSFIRGCGMTHFNKGV